MKEGDIGIRQDGSHLSSEPIWWMWAVDHQVVRSLSEKYPQDQQAAAFCSGCSGVKPQPDLCTARTRITLRGEKFLCSWVTSLISWELGGSGYVFFFEWRQWSCFNQGCYLPLYYHASATVCEAGNLWGQKQLHSAKFCFANTKVICFWWKAVQIQAVMSVLLWGTQSAMRVDHSNM